MCQQSNRLGPKRAAAAGVCAGLGVLAASAHAQCDPATLFGPETRFGAGFGASSLSVGDLNGDGAPDLIAGTRNSPGSIYILFGIGDGTFQSPVDFDTTSGFNGPARTAVGDVDGDGDFDVVTFSTTSDIAAVLFNDGLGVLTEGPAVSITRDPEDIALADLDNDGDLDLAVVGTRDGEVTVRFNDGTGVFSTRTDLPFGSNTFRVLAEDVDQDGLLDLVGMERASQRGIVVARNLGSGQFAGFVQWGSTSSQTDLVAADLDNDGDVDFAIAQLQVAGGSNPNIPTFLNDGSGGFPAQSAVSNAIFQQAIAAGDLDGNGSVDLVTAVLVNDAPDELVISLLEDGGSPQIARFPIVNNPFDVVLADFDNDGDLDAVVVSPSTQDISVLLNQCNIGPVIGVQPATVAVDAGSVASLSVETTLGTPPLAYQWRRNGAALSDGGTVAGVATPTLTISPASSTDSDLYDVVVTNAFGEATSATAALAVRQPCLVDVDLNGTVNILDVVAFITQWNQGCP